MGDAQGRESRKYCVEGRGGHCGGCGKRGGFFWIPAFAGMTGDSPQRARGSAENFEASGFRALKGVGWQWEQCRKPDPARVSRHWPELSAATLCVPAYGTRITYSWCRLSEIRLPWPSYAAGLTNYSFQRVGSVRQPLEVELGEPDALGKGVGPPFVEATHRHVR